MRILLIEDDESTAAYIGKGLREEGHVVDHAANGRDGLFLAMGEPFDIIVTDRMLPGPDGLSIIRALRLAKITTPILVLTALGEVEKRVEGLEAGADDYLAKPFAMAELVARLNALIRRSNGVAKTELVFGEIRLDTAARAVSRAGQAVRLTALEYGMLSYLALHAGRPISKTELTEHLYAQDFDRDSNTLEVIVARLRRKLGDQLIETVRGQGYRLVPG